MTEANFVSIWEGVFDFLLHGSDITVLSGEAVSNCTKRLRRIIKSTAKEDPDFGRKVDLLFYVDRLELGNVEVKHQKTSNMDVKLQHLKNIRINRAIMEGQHQICGTRSAIEFMDVKGWDASLFALYPFGDIYVSKHVNTISLPTTEAGMMTFLSDDDKTRSLDYLTAYVDHLNESTESLRKKSDRLAHERRHASLNSLWVGDSSSVVSVQSGG